jgi:two-component system, NarL family, response regulator DevR
MIVLLADDSPRIRTQLKELIALNRKDLLLYSSSDVESTIQSLQRYNVNVLILDLQFPDGSGYSVLEFIKRQEKRPFVMVLTNLTSNGVRYKSLQLGADLFFDKTEEYERVVEEIVRFHDR